MLKTYLDDAGRQLIVGLKGEKEEIETAFRSYWNHSATDGELEWVRDDMARFFSTRKKFERAILKAITFQVFGENDGFRGKKEEIRRRFNEKMANMRQGDLKIFNTENAENYYRVVESA